MKEKNPLTSKKLYLVGFPRHPWVYGKDDASAERMTVHVGVVDCFTSRAEAENYLRLHMRSEGAKCNIYELRPVAKIAA